MQYVIDRISGICIVVFECEMAQHTKGWAGASRRPLHEWWEKHRKGEATGFEGLVADWSSYVWEEGKVAGEVRDVAFLVGMRVRWIPAGTFLMGSPEDDAEAYEEEKPQHEVTLTQGFWMGETPVTQRQYLAIVGENPSSFQDAGLDAPVEMVSWYDAAAFANKLSALEGLPGCFVGSGEEMAGVGNEGSDYVGSKGWRLPTEAEWEYACRAGTTTPRYGDLNKIAWYGENSGRTTHPVGEKEPNAWGLYDMLGNVEEWCYDGYQEDPYRQLSSGTHRVDPVFLQSRSFRSYRGGGWYEDAMFARSASRDRSPPSGRGNELGIRVVRSSL